MITRRLTVELTSDGVCVLQVGWWDVEEEKWQTDGINEVKYDAETHSLSFSTTKLLSLGLLLSRIKLLPYDYWHYRPTSPTTGV
eukprot:3954289-Pyramimonas_sp.AAC.2